MASCVINYNPKGSI